MDILLIFWDGGKASFRDSVIESSMGLLTILENGDEYEYDIEDIKEFIMVNGFTLSYARDNGFEY